MTPTLLRFSEQTAIVTPTWVRLAELLAAVLFILALKGLSSPKSARRGNLLGAAGAAIATAVVFFYGQEYYGGPVKHLPQILGAIAIGSIIGWVAARRVQMTQMPQMVALFNGVGGGAAAVISVIEFLSVESESIPILTATIFTVVVGSVSFTGSLLTYAKLQELMTSRPVVIPLGRFITIGIAVATIATAVLLIVNPSNTLLWLLLNLSLVLGILLVLPVGGADVPIVISLLNAFTGLSVAASGYVLGNVLLIVAGTLVGASGTVTSQNMGAIGKSANGFVTGVGYSPKLDIPANKKFVADFQQAYNKLPDLYGADSYGLLYFYKAAVEKAKSTETDKVRTAMDDLSWQTPQGTKKMRAGDHQAMQDMFAVRVENGEFNIVGRVPSDQAIGPDVCTRF